MYKINKDLICIAISGLSGCGNTTVSKMLADTLGIEFVNYTFRNLAEEQNIDLQELHKMAATDDKWDLMVDKKQMEIASLRSCVIGSRLSIWMIPNADLKVYLDASEEVRSTRIHKREGGSLEEVTATTHRRDQENRDRYLHLYQIDVSKYKASADIVIDVNDAFPDEIVNSILNELQKKGII